MPTFISTHCNAHRLSLVACDASNASSMVQRFQRILNQIYVFFSWSTVRTSELRVQKTLDEPQLKLIHPTETRWLSHQNAVDALRKCLCAVHVTLQQEATQEQQHMGCVWKYRSLNSLLVYCFYQIFLQYLVTFPEHFNYHNSTFSLLSS